MNYSLEMNLLNKIPSKNFRKKIRSTLRATHPGIWPTRAFSSVIDFDSTLWAEKIRDLSLNLANFHSSVWYRDMSRELEMRGRLKFKDVSIQTFAELEVLFSERLIPLITSMRDSGYDYKKPGRPGCGLIGPDGQVIKSVEGRHRFATAREVGVKKFPLRIVGISRTWIRSILKTSSRRKLLEVLPGILKEVERDHVAAVAL